MAYVGTAQQNFTRILTYPRIERFFLVAIARNRN